LPVELIEAIEARATATGQTKTQITEAALCSYLGLEVGTDGPDLVQRIADVEQRLTDVEQRLTVSAQRRPTPPNATPATAPTTGAYRADGADSNAELPGDGMALPEALIAAGAPIAPDVALGTNRARAMDAATGQLPADWLKGRGWGKVRGKWYPPVV
jgi:hypothetical protein